MFSSVPLRSGAGLLIDSKLLPNDSVWVRARGEGFQVQAFDCSYFGKKKQVDAGIGAAEACVTE